MKRSVVVLALLVLTLAACGGGSEKTKTVTVEASATAAASATEAAATASATPVAQDPAIASRGGAIDGTKVQLDVIQFKRSGDTVALTIRLTSQADTASNTRGAQVSGTFDDGIFQKIQGASTIAGQNTLDGITLVDTTNDKRHLVGRDETGQCVCGTDLSNSFVRPDVPLLLSATYGAPPPDVKRLSIVIPSFGTLADVPLA